MNIRSYARTVNDESQTGALARDFSACVVPGTTISLNATLGAGKTRFVQAFAEACGLPTGQVVSPTYVICQEYATERFPLHHLDVYRLESDTEFLDLGSDELFAGDSVIFIEWGEQVASCLPADRIDVAIEVTGETSRVFSFQSTGSDSSNVLACLQGSANQHVYKILPKEMWIQAQAQGRFDGAAIDRKDGFIHFSAAHQVAETAAKHFAGQSDLVLVTLNTAPLGDSLRWEPSRGGDLFPHLYGPLFVDGAEKVVPLADGLEALTTSSS